MRCLYFIFSICIFNVKVSKPVIVNQFFPKLSSELLPLFALCLFVYYLQRTVSEYLEERYTNVIFCQKLGSGQIKFLSVKAVIFTKDFLHLILVTKQVITYLHLTRALCKCYFRVLYPPLLIAIRAHTHLR